MVLRPLVDDEGNPILDDQGDPILMEDGLAEESSGNKFLWSLLVFAPWGGDGSDVDPPPPDPEETNRWVWADGDVHTWANGEVSAFNEEP